MLLNNKVINYPAVTISKDWILSFSRSDEDLLICNKRTIKKGYFRDLKIVDSKGQNFIVEQAPRLHGP